MKFSTLVSLVAASSAALAFPFKKKDIPGVNVECVTAIKAQISDCITSEQITFSNLESICSAYKSEKCQTFFNSSISSIPACSGEVKDVVNSVEKSIKLHVASVIDLKCAKDENGNICPISNYVIQNGDIPSDPSDPNWQQAVQDTCKSKACSEAFINYTNTTNNNNNSNDVNQTIVNGVIGGTGIDNTPVVNPNIINNAADTIKNTQGDNIGNGTTSANGITGANGTTGVNGTTNGTTGQGTTNQANSNNNNSSSDATSLKASLTLAVVFTIYTLF